MSAHHSYYTDHIHKDTVAVLMLAALVAGLVVGCVFLRPATCAPYKETREHGTVCIVDDPVRGPHAEYTPIEP